MKRLKWIIILTVISSGLQGQSLEEHLITAAEQNASLKAKYKSYLAALELVDQQGALPDPTLSFGYFISPVETRVGPQRFRLSISQMFPWAGTLPLRKQAAAQMAKLRFEEFLKAKNELFLQVRMKWLELYELEQEIKVTQENLGILRSFEPVTKTKYEANLVSLADLIRVQINIDNAKSQLQLLSLRYKPLITDFNTLLNKDLNSGLSLPDSLPPIVPPIQVTDSLLANQPEINAAKAAVVLAMSEEQLAAQKRKPNIGFGLDYLFIGQRSGVIIDDNGKDAFMPTVSMSLPVFGKKNRSIRKAARFNRESKESLLESVEDQVRSEWVGTEFRLQAAQKEIRLYANEIQKTNVLLRVLTTEYTNDNRDFEELLATQQKLLLLKLSEARARIKYQQVIFEQDYLTATTLNQIK